MNTSEELLLRPIGAVQRVLSAVVSGECCMTWEWERGQAQFFHRRHLDGDWRLAGWGAVLFRLDQQGRRWETYAGRYVMEDFGALVPAESEGA